jgi:predicted type IV restriction endonuclease
LAILQSKFQARLVTGIKKFQNVLNIAKAKDINESDTVVIVTDILSELFGYDKYVDITSEYAIKKTYCDLALKIDGKIRILLEVKAIGIDLKDEYIKQAIDYGANVGVDWTILTNGCIWKVFKITYAKPIDKELVYEFDILKLNSKKQNDLDMLYYVCKESTGKVKSALDDYYLQKQILSRFFIGQVILTETVIDVIRRSIKKISPEAKVTNEEIKEILLSEVLKREVLEGDKVEEAKRRISKSLKASAKKETEKANKDKPIINE